MRVCSVSAVLIILCFSLALGGENPLKPKTGASLIPSSTDFVCGTYRGIEKESFWHYYQYKAKMKNFTTLESSDFVFDDVWVVEDDGTILISGVNPFDTDFQTFHFQPNGNGGYDVSSIPFSFDANLGANLNLGDDTNVTINFGFTFSYYGVNWSDVHVNANGMIAFGADANPSGFYDPNDFFSDLPKIASYFVDLNPAVGGGVFQKTEANKLTITWNNIPEFGTSNSNTIQLILYDDGSLDVTFNGIDGTIAAGGSPISQGIHPGGTPNLELISFSGDLPFSGGPGAGIYEQYLNIINPLVNEVALMQRFYQSFPDSFFQTIFFTNFVQTMGGFANEANISNNVQGIGLGIFDNSPLYGSNGVLESRCNMNRLAVWPTNPEQRFFGGGNNFLTIMGQEAGHRWGAFINFRDSIGAISNLILGRSDFHWSYYVDVDHSSLEGGNWEHVSGNLFTTPTQIDFFGDIDEYTMGLRTPEEVSPTFYVSSPTNNLPQNRSQGTPSQGATATGVPVTVTINDIIAAEGPRIPAEPDEQKDLRQAFILIVRNGTTPSQSELDKIANFRRAWEDYFEVSVDGRFTINTRLATSLPVAVVTGHVFDASTSNVLADVQVESVERGFAQFVPNGGRYTFRYMQSDSSTGAENVTIIVSKSGFSPDTFATSIPYGSAIVHDFQLDSLTMVGVSEPSVETIPGEFSLAQNYPNPFNPTTEIRYGLPQESRVMVSIYNVVGQEVATLFQGVQAAGFHEITWNGTNATGIPVASGIYFYKLEATGENGAQFTNIKKMLMLK